MGKAGLPRPEGPLLWAHLAPDADAQALAQLLFRLPDDQPVLLTHSDPRPGVAFPGTVLFQWLPVETDRAVQGFLDHWRPDVCVWVGGAWAPVLLGETRARGIPAFAFDARLSDALARRRRWQASLARAELSPFQRILTASPRDAARLTAFGADPEAIETVGFLGSAAAALPCNDNDWSEMSEALMARPAWLAVGVPESEIGLVLEAHRLASRLSHRLLLILAPEDPALGPSIARRSEEVGWPAALRTVEEEPLEETQVFIADSPGELGLWYRLAPVTFMGQTLRGTGPGRSPFEPAALGSAVVHGPRTAGHAPAYAALSRAAAALSVTSAEAL
ncbi:3-deoxy-D-manno-octulosonic acid transferase, partial [Oceaniglobus roseus]|uniref:3-deoxy-D-manno-octulosonic acid transferase n=1 Tax=Oceaniglobus roseus TaxID=1737570 RepID=UPI002481FBB3